MSKSNYNIRLQDPNNLIGDKFNEYEQKIKKNYNRLAFPSDFGGNPLAFAIASNKLHIVRKDLPFPTAATDGVNFYWHPEYLEKLSVDELFYTLEHEISHIIYGHVLPERIKDKNLIAWNFAIDFKVNSIQERSYKNRNKIYHNFNDFEHPIYKGNLGIPISLAELIKLIEKNEVDDIKKIGKKVKPVDSTVLDKTAEEIYAMIMEAVKKSPNYKNNLGQIIIPDDHMPFTLTKRNLIESIISAKSKIPNLPGSIANDIEDSLKELTNPEILWGEYCRSLLKNIKQNGGSKRNWTKFKRRQLHNKIYSPTSNSYKSRFIILLDTSASMSIDDITYCVSQLQSLVKLGTGVVIPVDAAPHWDKVTHINNINDVKSVKVVGRGGTVFNEFFKNYRKKVGDFDMVIVLTDGDFYMIDKSLEPTCPVIWVLCQNFKAKAPFGITLPLYPSNKSW